MFPTSQETSGRNHSVCVQWLLPVARLITAHEADLFQHNSIKIAHRHTHTQTFVHLWGWNLTVQFGWLRLISNFFWKGSLSINHLRHCRLTALTGFSNPSIQEQDVRTSSNNSLHDRRDSLKWQKTGPLLEAVTIWWAGCEGKELFYSDKRWCTSSAWQGHHFITVHVMQH